MNLVDEQDRIRVVYELLQHRLQTLFEIAAILGSREQRAHVEHVHLAAREDFGYLAFDDAPCETLGDGRLADARFAHEEGIVLAPPAQRLDDAFDLALAADQRVDFAHQRLGVEIERIRLESAAGLLLLARGFLFGFTAALRLLGGRCLGDAVRDIIHHVQTGDALLVQEIHGMGVFLAEDGDQHVGAGYFLLARGLDVQDRALDDALEAEAVPATVGVCAAMKSPSAFLSSSMLAAHARSTSAAVGLSSSASSRCSTVMNSCRFWRASTNAMCRLTSSSCAIMSRSRSSSDQRGVQLPCSHVSSITHCSGCWCLRA